MGVIKRRGQYTIVEMDFSEAINQQALVQVPDGTIHADAIGSMIRRAATKILADKGLPYQADVVIIEGQGTVRVVFYHGKVSGIGNRRKK